MTKKRRTKILFIVFVISFICTIVSILMEYKHAESITILFGFICFIAATNSFINVCGDDTNKYIESKITRHWESLV